MQHIERVKIMTEQNTTMTQKVHLWILGPFWELPNEMIQKRLSQFDMNEISEFMFSDLHEALRYVADDTYFN